MEAVMDDAVTWAEQRWGCVELGDARRTRRAVALGAGMARAPGAGSALETGCRLEERQLRTLERFWSLLGFSSIVAVRLLPIRKAARCTPQAASDEPDGAVRLLAAALKTSPAAAASHRDFHRGVARLGGFLARKGDGEPGWQTLWLGFEQLFLLMLGAQLAAQMEPPRCG